MTMGGCVEHNRAKERADTPTIVSLNPCTDAILAEVAVPAQLLAISHYSHDSSASSMDLDKARIFAATGGTVEEVLALDPDIVVASSFLAPATRQAFADLGVRVETFGIASTAHDSKAQIEQLAALAGNPDKGDALIEQIDIALDAAAAQGEPLSAVLWQPGGIVPGDSALVSELMQHTGFASHSAALGMGQADYLSLEQMLTNPPDVLLLAGDERAQKHPALAELSGTKLAEFDSALLYCGGPTIIRAVERLAEIRRQAE
ncbi:ABC transporter substrate-binding protein [Pontixanthobacter aestiaquae]|uniref:ABC transporter substrate-binding protein n=1 Tax=Pontixanthobacter aestiaquae TaxID=1509367 RepID=A0A844ZA64_9SPHN|nr:ABC transporter substrate-binding protein [Pontixanthobacter aestiaquae]MDN3645073.1 ABC transporter substrate-binding protein [Pontixanthobacter aestiaquae]MXO83927.1 ABC transporter substrate-binding protein [Pontixanthobacter aestiaquae]